MSNQVTHITKLKKTLQQLLAQIYQDFSGKELPASDIASINLVNPPDQNLGDLSSNFALIKYPDCKRDNILNPRSLAEQFIPKLTNLLNNTAFKESLATITVAGPGFINFHYSDQFYGQIFEQISKAEEIVASEANGKIIMIEFGHPNTHKQFHIGHLRNISLGESLVRLLEHCGYKVIRANYQGDVGLHIAKTLYGILNTPDYQEIMANLEDTIKKAAFLGQAYSQGHVAYEDKEEAKKYIHDLNYLIYASAHKFQTEQGKKAASTNYLDFVKNNQDKLDLVYDLWTKTRAWSLEYFETIYQKVHSHFDRYYFESECLSGVDIAKKALNDGILETSNGAIVFSGQKYNLDTRVFVNSLGLPTYEGKELALSEKQIQEYPNLEKIVHLCAEEQSSFFQVTFKVEALINKNLENKQKHLTYGFVRLKDGKMSSRAGNVITGMWLLDETNKKIKANFQELSDEASEKIALAAIKCSFLKVSTESEISFNFDESINLEGNSGPYLLYTYARARSVIERANSNDLTGDNNLETSQAPLVFNVQEKILLKELDQYQEIINIATLEFAPHKLVNYLFSLARIFNSFYKVNPILTAPQNQKNLRLAITRRIAATLNHGLQLLGLQTLEKM